MMDSKLWGFLEVDCIHHEIDKYCEARKKRLWDKCKVSERIMCLRLKPQLVALFQGN